MQNVIFRIWPKWVYAITCSGSHDLNVHLAAQQAMCLCSDSDKMCCLVCNFVILLLIFECFWAVWCKNMEGPCSCCSPQSRNIHVRLIVDSNLTLCVNKWLFSCVSLFWSCDETAKKSVAVDSILFWRVKSADSFHLHPPLAGPVSVFRTISSLFKWTLHLRLIRSDNNPQWGSLTRMNKRGNRHRGQETWKEWKLLTPHVVSYLKDPSSSVNLSWAFTVSDLCGSPRSVIEKLRCVWAGGPLKERCYHNVNSQQRAWSWHKSPLQRDTNTKRAIAAAVWGIITGQWIEAEFDRCLKMELSCRIRVLLKY